MLSELGSSNPKLASFLKNLAPYSIVDRGIVLSKEGNVIECSRSGSRIYGSVREQEDNHLSVVIEITSGSSVRGHCSCSSDDEMAEQWCSHAISLLWRAFELEFFTLHGGFASSESAYRMNTSSPREIAGVISEVTNPDESNRKVVGQMYEPQVSVLLALGLDRLGVQIKFDDEVQEPDLFEEFSNRSGRALDNILLQVLDDEGSWDEDSRLWYISSSNQLEVVLGLIQEYSRVVSFYNGEEISFSMEPINAQLEVSWQEGSAELAMKWILLDGEQRYKKEELLGTGPYWTVIDNVVYRLSPTAARIASIFPHSNSITLSRSQVGPIVQTVESCPDSSESLAIRNPELQPNSQVKSPKPCIEFSLKENSNEHFGSQLSYEIHANVEFDYPSPPAKENIVYLPDLEKEREAMEYLKSLGFSYVPYARNYAVSGDSALDLVERGPDAFPDNWTIEGLSQIQKNTKFSRLALDIAVNKGQNEERESSGIDWFDCHITLTQNNANVPISLLFKNTGESGDRWVRLDSGAYARVPGGGIEQLRKTLGLLSPNYRLSNTIKTQLSVAQAIGITRVEDERIHLSVDNSVKALARKLRDFESIQAIKPGKKFKGSLRSYQVEGLSWLKFLSDFQLGGILADEMGLGKTVQTLAYLQYIKDRAARSKKESCGRKPALVIAPTSVITNWLYEAKRFTPDLKVLLLHGPDRKALFSKIPEHDIVITSYALLRIDRQELCSHQFGVAVLDEAQNIKNPQAATTRSAKNLNAEQRLALTGTPTENRPLELWSIFDFLMPGYLGSLDFFKSHIEKPILEAGPGVNVAQFLNGKTRPFILRRAKAEVEKDLPDKIESELHVQMTQSQQEIYNAILAEVRPQVFEAVEERGVRGATVSILAALLRLRQVCNHPNSIEALKESPGYDSGKFQLFQEIVQEALESNRKILVFSQFRSMLSIMRQWLNEKEYNYLYLDGSTRNRQTLIDRFNEDEKVRLFLISLKAGGTGLNLTAADTVVIYDPWWNPAVESQAVDRAHRIGQTKNVNVYRLVTEHSIEQKIMELKTKKEQIVDALINDNAMSPLKLTKYELESLFSPLESV